MVIEIASNLGITLQEGHFSLTELYCADEVFTTGTMGELVAVDEIDGRKIGQMGSDKQLMKLKTAYSELVKTKSESID
jgi:branched-subunit amino acid aminotransferase/4-amino-4-deoxychorismate lyase